MHDVVESWILLFLALRAALSSSAIPTSCCLSHRVSKNEYNVYTQWTYRDGKRKVSVTHTEYRLTVPTHIFQSLWFDKKWQRNCHFAWFVAVFFSVRSQVVELSCRPQPVQFQHVKLTFHQRALLSAQIEKRTMRSAINGKIVSWRITQKKEGFECKNPAVYGTEPCHLLSSTVALEDLWTSTMATWDIQFK